MTPTVHKITGLIKPNESHPFNLKSCLSRSCTFLILENNVSLTSTDIPVEAFLPVGRVDDPSNPVELGQ